MKQTKTFKVWVSHNALSEGVREVEAVSGQWTGMVVEVRQDGKRGRWYQGEGKQWHRNREDAVAKAEKMRIKRIASLKAQIAKLEAMTFVVG